MGHNPTEHAQEHIHHTAAHGGGPLWITAAALTAALLAALAALTAFQASTHLTKSTLTRIEANDNWNYYQSKSIKSSIIDSRMMDYNLADPANMKDAVKKQHQDDIDKKAEYGTKPEEDDKETPKGLRGIQEKAGKLEVLSKEHLETHETFETAATMFHISIAVVAIAVVAKRKEFWLISIAGGAIGLYFFGTAFAHAPAAEEAKHEPAAAHVAPAAPGHEGGGAAHEGAAPAAEHKSGEAAH